MPREAALEIKIQDLPRIWVTGVRGPIESADDIHPIHKQFVDLVMSNAPAALSFKGADSPSGNTVRSGALVYGDYTGTEPKMSGFMQCLFIGEGEDLTESAAAAAAGLEQTHVELTSVDAGRYAVLTHSGAYAELSDVVRAAMYRALPDAGLRHSGGPIIEFYHGLGQDEMPVTELAIPVVSRQ